MIMAVQTNIVPVKKPPPGAVQASLVQASVSALQNPTGHCPLPRLSLSSRSASLLTSSDPGSDGSTLHSVMKSKTVLAVFVVVLLYLVCGGLAFRALEQPFESHQKDSIALEKNQFLQRNPCVSPAELEDLIKHAVDAVSAGVSPIGHTSYNSSHWDLGSAFFFAGTVITTIGYGNIAPSTEGGKIFCILYAIFGIPLFGFLLAGIGDQLGTMFMKSILKVERVFRSRRLKLGVDRHGSVTLGYTEQKHKQISPTKIRVTSTILFIIAGCIIFVTIPAVIFKHIEGWSTLEAIYFVVITLTTVGIGDYVAGGDRKIEYMKWYKPLVWFWILVGLAYFAAVLSMIGDWLRVLSKKTKEEVGGFKAHAAEWKANVRAEFRETRRRLSGEIHDKLQRAATLRSMERRRLGLEQRAHSLDMLSPEKRAVFTSLDAGRFKTSSQESINTKLNNLRLKLEGQQENSEENIFNRFGSLNKLAKRNRSKDLRRNIVEDANRVDDLNNTNLGDEKREEEKEEEIEPEKMDNGINTGFTCLPHYTDENKVQNGFTPAQVKEQERNKRLEQKEHQP
ncbi:hypothetical protein DNTS_028184 [Danionella cerebrum]|uniref:Potassium channel domain-containing protein n=1 Tax=Danionella cerebrum TaxID=2873325 RepID=A0A553QRT0_9TELE|nr:hypothetical protein DNTS_028184 [Danionella translucida]